MPKKKIDLLELRKEDNERFKAIMLRCGVWSGAELNLLREFCANGTMTGVEGLFVAMLQNQRILLEILAQLQKNRIEITNVN